MGSNAHNQLIGLIVVRGPSWAWEKQDGGEGFVGSVVGIVGNGRNVRVLWDSGNEYIYRIGAENAYDLRVLDNSTVGVKHVGVKCQGIGVQDIAGLRWECLECQMKPNFCTFCLTNEIHDGVNWKRYDQPSSINP